MICGAFDPQARPGVSAALTAMLDATRHRGPDGADRWADDSLGVALGQHWLRITPEDQQAHAPWRDEEAQVVAVIEGRLDNRDELIRALGVEAAAGRAMADGALLCAAYGRWGPAFAEHLQGEYVAAVWDGRARRLVTANSRTNAPPIFDTQHDGVWHFASDMRAIVAIPGRTPRPNLTKIAALAYPGGSLAEPTVTYYEGVRRQPSASVMLFTSDAEPRAQVYWRPQIREFPYRSDDEWIDAIRTALFDAVRARLRTAHPVAALLSGGLDSSILCAVAATILAEQGREMISFSAVLPDGADPSLRDERAFIDEMAAFPNLKRVYVSDPWRGPFDDLENILRGSATPVLTSRHYQYAAFAAAARAHGAKTLFDGVGGEFSVTQYGHGYVWECLLALRWGEAARRLRDSASAEKRSVRAIVRGEILDPLAARLLPQHHAQRWASVLLRREFLDRMPRPACTLRTTASLRDHRAALLEAMHRIAGNTSNDGYWGYENPRLTMPFSAPALLELCLAAPGRLKTFRGRRRGLARRVMQNLLPPKILWRTDKMPFAPDYHSRYQQSRDAARSMLDAVSQDADVAQIVDLTELRRRLDQSNTLFDEMHIVPYTFDTATFLNILTLLRAFAITGAKQ